MTYPTSRNFDHLDTRYIAIGNCIDMLALYPIRSDVETAMKMIGTRFTEIPRQRDFVIHWRGKYTQEYA